MYSDMQIFKRCCFCLPLRQGLLTWGYVKMVPLLYTINMVGTDLMRYPDPIIIIIFIALVAEIIFNFILLIAAHIKNTKLLKTYYFFIILESTAVIILLTLFTCVRLHFLRRISWKEDISNATSYFVGEMGFFVTVILLDIYLMLLVRSEVKKLESENLTCSFVNNEAELRCDINKMVVTV